MFIGYLMPGFMFPTILDRMKWNDYLPSPLKQWRRREGAKTRQFGITEMAGGVVQISFILSKIVGNRWKSGLLSHKLSRRWGWFMSCTKTRCITNRIKFCCLLKGYSWKTGRSWSTWRSWTDRKSNIWRYWSHWESVNSISCQYRADTWCRDGHVGVVSKQSNFSPLGDDFFSLSYTVPLAWEQQHLRHQNREVQLGLRIVEVQSS